MPDFSKLWENPLLSTGILKAGRENKSEFAQKAQGRLEQNPPIGAPFPPLITASRAALDLFITAKDGTSLGLQKAATERLDALMPIIRSTGEVLEGRLKADFESDPAVITEFFPRGRTAVSTAKRGDVLSVLNNWVARATERQGVLGAAWVTRLTNLRTQWTTNLDAQSGKISSVSASRSDFDQTWEALSWAFFDIAQQLALANPRNPTVADAYFDFSIFEGRTNYNADGKGKVKVLLTNYSNEPLVNAPVTVKDPNGQIVGSGMTDNEGRYESRDIPIGFYDVMVSFPNYLPRVYQVQVFDDRDPTTAIQLTHE